MKMERHSKIVELIGKYEIETQEELAEYLNKEGYNVTQATVSRDIRELMLSKIQTENGGQKYAVFHPQTAFNDKYTRILHDSFVSMDMAQNILVIKTVSGMAMAVAAALDAIHCRLHRRGRYGHVRSPYGGRYDRADGQDPQADCGMR